jgi:hypothetical protein
MRLEDRIPKDKFDPNAIENAAALGFSAIKPILPEFLDWIQHANWSVAQCFLICWRDRDPKLLHISMRFSMVMMKSGSTSFSRTWCETLNRTLLNYSDQAWCGWRETQQPGKNQGS